MPLHLVSTQVRRSGRPRSGRTTVWGRTALASHRPWLTLSLLPGVVRVWLTRMVPGRPPVGLVVSVTGLTWWTTLGTQTYRGDYLTTSFVPVPVVPGLTTLLRWVPVGTSVFQVSFFARAPGTQAQVLRHRRGATECRLPSRATRWISWSTCCVVGSAGYSRWFRHVTGSAGAAVRDGRRPRVRGVAMNPVDHPHGGGQGKTAGGRPGTTPWGRLTKGYKTVR